MYIIIINNNPIFIHGVGRMIVCHPQRRRYMTKSTLMAWRIEYPYKIDSICITLWMFMCLLEPNSRAPMSHPPSLESSNNQTTLNRRQYDNNNDDHHHHNEAQARMWVFHICVYYWRMTMDPKFVLLFFIRREKEYRAHTNTYMSYIYNLYISTVIGNQANGCEFRATVRAKRGGYVSKSKNRTNMLRYVGTTTYGNRNIWKLLRIRNQTMHLFCFSSR